MLLVSSKERNRVTVDVSESCRVRVRLRVMIACDSISSSFDIDRLLEGLLSISAFCMICCSGCFTLQLFPNLCHLTLKENENYGLVVSFEVSLRPIQSCFSDICSSFVLYTLCRVYCGR